MSQNDKPSGGDYGAKVATAELENHQVQDLADQIDELRQVTAGKVVSLLCFTK